VNRWMGRAPGPPRGEGAVITAIGLYAPTHSCVAAFCCACCLPTRVHTHSAAGAPVPAGAACPLCILEPPHEAPAHRAALGLPMSLLAVAPSSLAGAGGVVDNFLAADPLGTGTAEAAAPVRGGGMRGGKVGLHG